MRTSTIAAAGSRIRVIEDGAGEHAVLFVHGVGGWAENWSEEIERGAAAGGGRDWAGDERASPRVGWARDRVRLSGVRQQQEGARAWVFRSARAVLSRG